MTAERPRNTGSTGLPLTGAYLLAMVLLYIGERLSFESTVLRISLAAVAGALVAFAIAGRLRRIRTLGKLAQQVESRILVAYLVGFLALGLYLLQADFMMDWLRPKFDADRQAERYEVVMAALWLVVWACAIVPLIFMELSYATMDTSHTVELPRIRRSAASGLVVTMTLGLVFSLNYIFSETNTKVDLSYFKTTRPSESSVKMVQNLSDPLEVVAFFPPANEVLDQVKAYFDELTGKSKHLRLRVVDQVLEPKLAKEMGASKNGMIVFRRAKKAHVTSLGTQLSRAKSKLKKLDGEFQEAFLKLARSRRNAYFTVGHEELTSKPRDGKQGASVRGLRTALKKMNYTVKDLGITQGLASKIPRDATMVFVIGPRKAFLPSESKTLLKYLEGGGRAAFFLDPSSDVTFEQILGPLGVKYTPQPLAVQVPLAHINYTKADRHIIVSNRFGSHTSATSLNQRPNERAVVMLGAGFVEKTPTTTGNKTKVSFTIHSMPMTWNDAEPNFAFDKDKEKRKLYELAAAVEMPAKAASQPGSAKPTQRNPDMRVVVVADADVVSDGLLYSRAIGNRYLILDAVKWLGGEEKFVGEVTSEEDVKIAHTRKGDQVWFYLTIFAVPALVLGAGVVGTRRRRRRR